MEDIKQMIADAAKEIIDGVDGISEGTKDYDNLLNQLIRIQSLNYQAEHPDVDLGIEPDPEPLEVNTPIRKAAAQIEENRATQEALEYLEDEQDEQDEEEEPVRH